MHLKAQKPALVPFHYWTEIEKLSKAALMDVAWSFAIRCCGIESDDTAIMAELRCEAENVLNARKIAS